MTSGNRQFTIFEMLTVIDTALQLADYDLNMRQSTNDDIMRQLDRQNDEYLKKIIEQQKEILNILGDLKSSMSAE